MIHQKLNSDLLLYSLCLLLLLVPGVRLQAAERDSTATIAGTVFEQMRTDIDKWQKVPIPDAFVSVRVGKDSVVSSTDRFGHFSISGVKPGPVHIWSAKMGFEDYSGTLDASSGVNIILIELKQAHIKLASAMVVAEAKPIIQKGDTTIFNAAAVSTGDQDNAIEILAQMPGISFDKGRILVNGEPVKRTYVNGKLIFGDDSMTPLTSILASDVVNIKTYEEESIESRRYGLEHGKKDRVLDVTTRDPIISSFNGYAMASGGADFQKDIDGNTQGRYGAGLVGNFFSEKFLAYLTAHANNLGKDSFRQDEYLRSDGSLLSYEEKAGISAGVEKYWGDRLLGSNVKASYEYNCAKARKRDRLLDELFDESGSVFRTDADTTSFTSRYGRHLFGLNSSLYSESLGSFMTINRFSAADNSNISIESRSMTTASSGTVLFTHPEQYGRGRDYSFTSSNIWSGIKTANGWIPGAAASFSFSDNTGSDIQIDTMSASDLFRHITAGTASKSYSGEIEASAKKILVNDSRHTSSISFKVQAGYNYSGNFRSSFDISPAGLESPNPDNSYDYSLSDRYGHLGVFYSWAKGKTNLEISAFPGIVQKSDSEIAPTPRRTSKVFFVPHFGGSFKSGNFSVALSSQWRAPDADRFHEWIDDRNPLFLTTGNSSLVPVKSNLLYGNYVINNQQKYSSLILYYSINITLDPIVSKIESFAEDTALPGGYIAKSGSLLSSYQNADYSLLLKFNPRWEKRFQKFRTNLSLSPSVEISRDMAFAGSSPVILHGYSPSISSAIRLRPDKNLSLAASAAVKYELSRNDSGLQAMDRLSANSSLTMNYNFLKVCFFGASYRWKYNHFLNNTGINDSAHFLNAVLGTRLMKGRMGLSISFNDILNAGHNYTMTVSPNSRVQVWTPSYGRYLIFNLSFRLNKKNSGTEYRGELQSGGEFLPPEARNAEYEYRNSTRR